MRTSRTSSSAWSRDIARYRDLETLLRKTLVSAERSAQELKDQAPPRGGHVPDGGARGGAADQAAARLPSASTWRRGEPDPRRCSRSALAMVERTGDGDESRRPPRPPELPRLDLAVVAVDVERFRDVLEEERRRVLDAIEYLHEENPGSTRRRDAEESSDNHLADTATETLDREIDYTLEENSEHVLAAIDAGARSASRRGPTASCANCGKADRRGAPGGASVGDPVHRLPPPARSAVERAGAAGARRSRRFLDRRSDAARRCSIARWVPRSAAVARPARGRPRRAGRRPADEAHRLEPARARRRSGTSPGRSRSTTCRTRGSRSGSSRARRRS